jgi:hypothetical protein
MLGRHTHLEAAAQRIRTGTRVMCGGRSYYLFIVHE